MEIGNGESKRVCVCVFKWQSNAFNQGTRQREKEEVMEY